MKTSTNIASVLNTIHFETGSPDATEISKLLREKGLTPYIFIRMGFKYLVHGNYSKAQRYINYAMEFRGEFFKADTPEDREYCVEMQLLSAACIFLTQKFKKLPPEVDPEGIEWRR